MLNTYFIQNVTKASLADAERVHVRTLNAKYGCPEGVVHPGKNMFPTVPSYYVTVCNKGPRYLYHLPVDEQARLICCLLISHRSVSQVQSNPYCKMYNNGLQYGDLGFKTLSSFRTL